jgi:hypothetical protein
MKVTPDHRQPDEREVVDRGKIKGRKNKGDTTLYFPPHLAKSGSCPESLASLLPRELKGRVPFIPLDEIVESSSIAVGPTRIIAVYFALGCRISSLPS